MAKRASSPFLQACEARTRQIAAVQKRTAELLIGCLTEVGIPMDVDHRALAGAVAFLRNDPERAIRMGEELLAKMYAAEKVETPPSPPRSSADVPVTDPENVADIVDEDFNDEREGIARRDERADY